MKLRRRSGGPRPQPAFASAMPSLPPDLPPARQTGGRRRRRLFRVGRSCRAIPSAALEALRCLLLPNPSPTEPRCFGPHAHRAHRISAKATAAQREMERGAGFLSVSRRSGSKVAEPHSLLQEFKHALVERLVEDDAAFASTGPNDGREDFNRTRTDQQLLTGTCALA